MISRKRPATSASKGLEPYFQSSSHFGRRELRKGCGPTFGRQPFPVCARPRPCWFGA